MTNPSKSSPESPAKEGQICKSCHGSGTVRGMTQGHGPDDYETDVTCPDCNGTGESPAKEQPGEQNAALGLERAFDHSVYGAEPAHDAVAMVKRLRDMVQRARTVRDTLREDGRPHTANIVEDLCKSAEAASAMIEKLGQRIETLQAAHDLGWAHKECPNCGADMMTGAKLGQEWIHGAWDNDAISAMAGAALQSFPKIGYMENATKIVRAVLKTQEEYRSPPPPERP